MGELTALSSVSSNNGFFSVAILPEQSVPLLNAKGYYVIKDFPLEFHDSAKNLFSEMDQIREYTGSELAQIKYNYTGNGVKIAIVDTGVDFSNPDLKDSLARDENNYPIMLDADGQGIVLTNATFAANIDKYGVLENVTKPVLDKINKSIGKNATSNVYITKNGVFLNLKQKGKGTPVLIYNSFFPSSGLAPKFNGTVLDDYKIGKTKRDYIKSASGIYHFGMMYQGAMQGPFTSVQAVPVLVVDSKTAGVYDTIIPDLTTSWQDYTKFDLKKGQKPDYDFDFTDETPIQIGSGNEYLVYDSNKDGKLDYSAGTVGAQVVDVYGVISQNKSAIDKSIKATNGTLLPPLDPQGNFFGVMTDFVGHGTGAAASIASKGKEQYDIYNNTKKYTLAGVAPNAKIIPIKALWFGDTVYGWLWASGFDNKNNTWHFSGKPRADIISNSWGISNFPSLKTSPGVDILSLIVDVLSTPQSVDPAYPGVTVISSAGNAGHGYGTMGLPNAAPFGITVGATTNNVYVGYGTFKGQPRFGNTTEHANNLVDFSSRGPSIIGDPKPDLVDTGAYGFVPSNVLKAKKNSKVESFSMFGGTSMAAPLVAGSAAVLIQSLKDKNQDYDSFMIKNILMSTATDTDNDPFTQGSGLVNSYRATQFVNGQGDVFIAYNNSTYKNVKEILDMPITKLNSTILGFDTFQLPEKTYPQTSWFAGRLTPGEKSTTTYTIVNPSNHTITVQVVPQKISLIGKSEMNSTTKLLLKDALYNKTGVFRPDYIKLQDIQNRTSLSSYYENKTNLIPHDAELMVMNLNFAFPDFLNKTEKMYAADTKIASLYLYDWKDKNTDDKVSSDELSLVNRGGTWGTVQELRVSEPNSKFKNTPLVGVYPVPTRYSYWIGDTKKNSTEMNYMITTSYYKKENWDAIWLDNGMVEVLPHGTAKVYSTITVPDNAKPGLYQGFIRFIGNNHTVNSPVSFAVVSEIKKDKLVVIAGEKNSDALYGNGYVKGAFDMSNRYNAGDWRQYYFDIKDPSINTASIDISWQDQDTNFSAFVIDPQGRIVQTNVPSGVFGQLLDWPTSDWLGTTPFSEGGGFYPVKNKDATSTLLSAQINQTGTYTLLLHSTLFGGQSITEPFTVAARFSSISADDIPPIIDFAIPRFVNDTISEPTITDDGNVSVKYYLDGTETDKISGAISDGKHDLKIEATDESGNTSVQFYSFIVDKAAPQILISNPQNNTVFSGVLRMNFAIKDDNPNQTFILLPDGTTIQNQTSIDFDTARLADGKYQIIISAMDEAGNKNQQTVLFEIDNTGQIQNIQQTNVKFDYNLVLLMIAGVFAIGITIFIILGNKRQKLPKY
jgi:subtilisin family serine protease